MDAKEFNEKFPFRTQVLYTNSLGGMRVSTIKGAARVMTGGAIVCRIEGVSGEIDISRLEKITPDVKLKKLKTVSSVDDFNLLYPPGSQLKYYPVKESDEYRIVTTRSRAWLIGCNIPIVKVEGIAGGVHIEQLEAYPDN